jgi:hypothetical protein
MYFHIKQAKKATKNHYDFTGEFLQDNPKSIKKGEKFLQFHNGTIGQGARAVNIGRKQAIELLENLLSTLKDNTLEETSQAENTQYDNFYSDDIPF